MGKPVVYNKALKAPIKCLSFQVDGSGKFVTTGQSVTIAARRPPGPQPKKQKVHDEEFEGDDQQDAVDEGQEVDGQEEGQEEQEMCFHALAEKILSFHLKI